MKIKEISILDEKELDKYSDQPRDLVYEYINQTESDFLSMPNKLMRDSLLSEHNYLTRRSMKSCRGLGYTITVGDICYIDYGRAYIHEIGYQHFGLVVNMCYAKALVIPMTSNKTVKSCAYQKDDNPDGMLNLMSIGRIEGLTSESVLFLNDAKFINTARIIDVKGHIDKDSLLFKEIMMRLYRCINEEI